MGGSKSIARLGVGEAVCTCHAVNLGLKSLELQSESTDERDELLTTLAPVRRVRAGGMRLWKERHRLWCSLTQRWWRRRTGRREQKENGARGSGARGGCGSPT